MPISAHPKKLQSLPVMAQKSKRQEALEKKAAPKPAQIMQPGKMNKFANILGNVIGATLFVTATASPVFGSEI